jgi:hypothetical protein
MEHGTVVRRLMRAATLSLLVLATTSGVASVDMLAASPAMAEPDGQGGGSAPGQGNAPDPTAAVTNLVGGALGGQNAPAR